MMRLFAWTMGLSIRSKLLLITLAVLSIGGVAGSWWVLESYRESMLDAASANSQALAATIAEYGVAPLVFDDAPGAEEILGKLVSNREVVRATLFDQSGEPFARYERGTAARDGQRHATLVAEAPVVYEGRRVGRLVLETSTGALERRIDAVMRRIALGSTALVLLCALLALRLQRTITGPLARLSSAMQRVGARGELGERLSRGGGADEISALFARFNDMLEQLQQRSRERDRTQLWLRTLIESLPDEVLIFDRAGHVIEALHDEDAEAVPVRAPSGLRIHDLMPGSVADEMLRAVEKTLESGDQVRLDYRLEGDQGVEHFEALLTPIGQDFEQEGERLVLALSRNVTERRLLQEQFLRSQKMEAVGQLAGGIAHDFNNMLTGIMGYAELIQQGHHPSTNAEQILHISERAAELVRQLLTFSRKATSRDEPTNVNDLVERVRGILSHTLDPRITLTVRAADVPCTVVGDASQLEAAVLNLAVNARDAMPEGGTLSLTTRIVELDVTSALAIGEGLSPGSYVEVAVADTGEGIPEDVLGRIFEPFFTTKAAGKGTGLGLAAVYGTARSHRGAVQVRSRPGQGSVFRLFIPLASDQASVSAGPSVYTGSGRLLLLDDEEAVRLTAAELLRGLGYEVEVFGTPHEAIAYFEKHHTEVDAVILDMVMPEMNGGQVAECLRRISPAVRILIASGYLALDEQLPESLANLPLVSKPFTLAELARAVESLLAQPVSRSGLRVVH